jgi:hypothetical protein
MHRLEFLTVALGFVLTSTIAAAPTTQSASTPTTRPATITVDDQSSPMAMMRASDILRDVGPDAYVRFYHAQGDDGKRMMAAETRADAQFGLLILMIEKKWGKAADDDITHALGGFTMADLEAGDLKIDGDHATLAAKGDDTPFQLIRIDGKWKFDIEAMRKQLNQTPDEYVDGYSRFSGLLSDYADAIDKGQIKTVDQAVSEAKRRYDALWSDGDK